MNETEMPFSRNYVTIHQSDGLS